MRIAVITFPASNCDRDAAAAIRALGGAPLPVHHSASELPPRLDGIILPGGFSYGDYLRPGCMAAHSPIMREVSRNAAAGMPVLGICNGFQLLTEAGLLPGALLRNRDLLFVCRTTRVRVEHAASPFLREYRRGAVLAMPVAHKDGNYHADPETLRRLEDERQILLRYCDETGAPTEAANPNGSARNIAAVSNPAGNVMGLMPHPERCADPLLGGEDGAPLLRGMLT